MARVSPVRDCFLLCGEGRIYRCRIRFNSCSYCGKPIEFNSEMVLFQTTSAGYHCHIECEVALRHKLEREYWENWEAEKKEKIEVAKLVEELKKKPKKKKTTA